jgi:hypothetical protein
MSKVPIRIIAILEIIGGLFGMVFVIWAMIHQTSNIFSRMIGIVEVLIEILAVVAGTALWAETSFGRKASLAIQLIQLPKITSPAIIFMFSFGFDVWVHASSDGVVGIQTSVSFNQLFLNVPNAPVDFGISITAIIALAILKKYEPPSRALGPLPPPPPGNWSVVDDRTPNSSEARDREVIS